MTALLLHRRTPAPPVSRFYHLAVQPDLFGAWCVVREWGRIGSPGRMQVQPFATEAEASAAAARLRRQKERKGYRGVPEGRMAAALDGRLRLAHPAAMTLSSPLDTRLAQMCSQVSLEMISRVDRQQMTLGWLEQTLAAFAAHIRREVEHDAESRRCASQE